VQEIVCALGSEVNAELGAGRVLGRGRPSRRVVLAPAFAGPDRTRDGSGREVACVSVGRKPTDMMAILRKDITLALVAFQSCARFRPRDAKPDRAQPAGTA
jgi:hypothetical protein